MFGQAVVFVGVNRPEVRDIQLPALKPHEVLVETAYSCISPGTEMRCLAGKQDGAHFPFIPGYSLSGRIVAIGEDAALAIGTPVFCTGTAKASLPLTWGGHVSHAVQPACSVYPIPAGVDLLEASSAHIAAISYHGMRLSRPQAHEKVVVIGLGIIGQFAARLHALSGADVLGVDLSAERVRLLRDAGIDAVPNIAEARSVLTDGADVIVDASGANSVIHEAVELARDVPWDDSSTSGSRYLIQGSYEQDFCVPYQPAFIKQLSLWLPRDAQPRDFRSVLDFVARRKLPVRDLITEVAQPGECARIYNALQKRDILTAVFAWQA